MPFSHFGFYIFGAAGPDIEDAAREKANPIPQRESMGKFIMCRSYHSCYLVVKRKKDDIG